MAAVNMPDFKLIDELIGSLRELDEHFSGIVTDADEREQGVKQSCVKALKEEAAASLAGIPVEELKNSKAGIRVGALQKAGFHTLLDLYNAQDWQIQNVEGVGDKQITSIRNILGEFLRRLSGHSRIRLTADRDDRKSLMLITQIARYRQCSKIGQEAAPLVGALHTYAEEAPGRVLIRSRLRWVFSRRKTKEDTILAVGGILAYLRSPECARVKNLIDLYEQARSLSEEEALDDFKKNGAAYYALIEKLTGTGADRELIYSSIPAQLADEIDAFALETGGFKGDLRAYQAFGARYILTLGRVLLGDEMGLGKTIQAIAAMAHLHAKDPDSRFLIVCPASVMVNWCRELHKFSEIRALLMHGAQLGEALESWKQDGGAAVTNYESLSKIVGAVDGQMKLSMLVIDEAHYIKNPEAKRTRYIHTLEDEAERILMMTGTPLENKVEEMCELIGFVRPDLVEEIRSSAGMRHVPQFREILAPVYLRRRREMVLSELPPLTMEEEWCAMTPEDSEAYREQVQKGNFIGMRRVSFLQEDLSKSSKAVRLREICEEAIEEEKKVVVYSYFRDTIGKVIGLLGEAVEGSITGSTPAQERQDIIDRFTAAPGGRILVCQVQSGGTGLNIQAAGIVIFCEPQIKPSLTWQSLSRVYRMGQVQNVLVCHLLCENTADEAVMEILARKEEEFDLFAQESTIADAAEGLTEKEWIRNVVEAERRKFLPAVL